MGGQQLSADLCLPESDDSYRFFAEALPQIVWIATTENQIIYINRQWSEYTGLTLEETQAGGWAQAIHPDDYASVVATVAAGRESNGGFEAEYRLKRAADGLWRWHLGISRLVRTPDGTQKWFGTAIDIDDRKRADEHLARSLKEQRQTEEKLLVLVEASSALIASTDPAQVLRTILELAKRFVRADAYAVWRKQQEGLQWSIVASDGLSPKYSSTVTGDIPSLPHFAVPVEDVENAGLENSAIVKHRIAAYREEGIRSILTVPLVIQGNTQGTITFYYRTPHRFSEIETRVAGGLANLAAAAIGTSELNQRLETLYRDAKEARDALQRSNAELKRANDDLNDFAWSASHDLQEPLRMVAIYNQMLAAEFADRLDENGRQYIHYSVQGARQMEMLIRDILAYTNAAAMAGEPPTLLRSTETLRKVMASLEATIRASGAIIEAGDLPELMMHEAHLVQILEHLIANAIKYRRPEPPRIRIHAEKPAESLENHWRFQVSDNGIGISPAYAQQIFGIFKRLHTSAEYPGTGVGLAICQKIVERYGGRMWVESEPGKGSTFLFTLPAA